MTTPRVLVVALTGALTLLCASTPASGAWDRIDTVSAPFSWYNTVGGDEHVWSTVPDGLRRLEPDGAITTFAVPGASSPAVTASDGSVWVGGDSGREVWRIDPTATNPTPALVVDFGTDHVGPLVPAGDGHIWARLFSSSPDADTVVLMDATGLLDSFSVPFEHPDDGFHPTAGAPDGSLWFGTQSDPSGWDNNVVTRVGLDGVTSNVALATGIDPDEHPEDVTSMGFDSGGTLWYTTYDVGYVTVSGDRGGGIGRYASGVSDWWPRPLFPEDVPDATHSSGPLPDLMQRGPDGLMYFSERSAAGSRLSRVDAGGRVQFVEVGKFFRAFLGEERVWWVSGSWPDEYGVANLAALFEVRTSDRRVSLQFRPKASAFVGEVRSGDSGCRPAALELYRVRPGKDALVRKGRTSESGTFSLVVGAKKLRDGRYYVTALRRALPGGIVTCGSDRSPLRTLR